MKLTFWEGAGPFSVILANSNRLAFDHVTSMTMKLDDFACFVSATALNVTIVGTGRWFANDFFASRQRLGPFARRLANGLGRSAADGETGWTREEGSSADFTTDDGNA